MLTTVHTLLQFSPNTGFDPALVFSNLCFEVENTSIGSLLNTVPETHLADMRQRYLMDLISTTWQPLFSRQGLREREMQVSCWFWASLSEVLVVPSRSYCAYWKQKLNSCLLWKMSPSVRLLVLSMWHITFATMKSANSGNLSQLCLIFWRIYINVVIFQNW